MTFARLLRTAAPLKPVQIYGRAWFRLHRPKPDPRPAPPVRVAGEWIPAVSRDASLLSPIRVRFLNQEGDIDEAAAWNDPGKAKLWLYNLHYFDDLAGPASPERDGWRRRLIDRWIAENPPGFGNGWEPYPTSLRLVNWIKWALAGNAMKSAWLDSLAAQARWLVKRLEWHLLGNHLFANAKALVFAGLFFEGPEAEGWLRRGLGILEREIPEQVLADGGHFERSPMYHAIILEDVLDLINLGKAYGMGERAPFSGWRSVAASMSGWASVMTHPDGDIPFFNDAAFGIAPRPVRLTDYAARLGAPQASPGAGGLIHLADSGYLRAAAGEAVAFVDAAPVGPSYLPGHAHADTLSFELSLGDERVIVNGGTSTYAPGPQREAERATRAHSTVEVDGEDSSEVWASFRVGRRARVFDLKTAHTKDAVEIAAAHDGYRGRPGRPIHRRAWRLDDTSLRVIDRFDGRPGRATAYFHLPSGVTVDAGPGGAEGALTLPGGRLVRWRSSSPMVVRSSTWSSRFGEAGPSVTLAADAVGGLETQFNW